MRLLNSVAAALKKAYPEQVQDAPDGPDHYFIPESVRKGQPRLVWATQKAG